MRLLEEELAELSTGDDEEFKQFSKRSNMNLNKKTNKKKRNKSTFYFKKFNIPMDRSYTDRD